MRLVPFVILFAPFVAGAVAQEPATVERPNIVYVMVDDAGWGDYGANGSEHIQTPVFDRMCAEGIRFTDHYAGSAVCAPTRAVLMTGLHPGHARRRDNTATGGLEDFEGRRPLVFLQDEDLTVAEVLQQAGYVTAGIGKWGIGNPGTTGSPDKQGFDHFYGYLDQVHAHDHYTDWLWRDGEREEIEANRAGGRQVYVHDLFEAETLRFVREHRDQRFFLYLPYTLPHGKYEIPSDAPYGDRPWSPREKNYAAMITRADQTVGRLLAVLEELELDERTIVFYTSDNGPNRAFLETLDSNGPFRGTKRFLTEGGLRAPMAVRWPGRVPAGVESDFVWSMTDWFPTACALAGVEAPDSLDGQSVLPTLLGEQQEPCAFQYWEIHHPFQQAVRAGRWKAVRFGTLDPVQLYDLVEDPGEERDLAAAEPEVAARLARILDQEHTPSRYYPAREHAEARRGEDGAR